jgi:hypothetical protein
MFWDCAHDPGDRPTVEGGSQRHLVAAFVELVFDHGPGLAEQPGLSRLHDVCGCTHDSDGQTGTEITPPR